MERETRPSSGTDGGRREGGTEGGGRDEEGGWEEEQSGSIPSEQLCTELRVQDKKVRGRWEGDLCNDTNRISGGSERTRATAEREGRRFRRYGGRKALIRQLSLSGCAGVEDLLRGHGHVLAFYLHPATVGCKP